MKENIKYIVKEVMDTDFSFYFDCDCYSKAAGDYNFTVFCVNTERYSYNTRYTSGINGTDFNYVVSDLNAVIDEIDTLLNYESGYSYKNIKEIMLDYDLNYNSHNAHKLKTILDIGYIDAITMFLSMRTGKSWKSLQVCGYCQGDYTDVVYCSEKYDDKTARIIGELYLGCGKEFSITYLDENGEETDTIYGHYVADCEYITDAELKELICSNEGIEPEQTRLELIESVSTVYTPSYRIA